MLLSPHKAMIQTSVFFNVFLISFFITFLISRGNNVVVPELSSPSVIRIIIDTKFLELTVLKDNQPLKRFPVAIGKPGTPSPVGDWLITNKEKWGEGFGSHWLGLNVPFGMFGIHGTNNPGSIGNIISGGCIRMFNRDVEQVYHLVKRGTPVHIIGDPFKNRRVLLKGIFGSDVLFLQKRLKQFGLFRYNPNGVFGYYTEQAVLEFQKQNKLPATGQVKSLEYRLLRLNSYE